MRTPIEMDHEHPEILPLPWVNPVIADHLEDARRAGGSNRRAR